MQVLTIIQTEYSETYTRKSGLSLFEVKVCSLREPSSEEGHFWRGLLNLAIYSVSSFLLVVLLLFHSLSFTRDDQKQNTQVLSIYKEHFHPHTCTWTQSLQRAIKTKRHFAWSWVKKREKGEMVLREILTAINKEMKCLWSKRESIYHGLNRKVVENQLQGRMYRSIKIFKTFII